MNKDLLSTQVAVQQDCADRTITPENVNSILLTFAVSLFLLLLVSLVKYHTEKENGSKDWSLFFLELPIDIMTAIITMYISFNYLVAEINILILIIVVELIAVVVSCIMRNKMVKNIMRSDNDLPIWKTIGCVAAELLLCFLCPLYLLYNIMK